MASESSDKLKTVNVCKRLHSPLKEALLDETDVLALRLPVYYKMLYKMCLSKRKKDVLRSIVAAAIEALAINEGEELDWRTLVEGVKVEMKLDVAVRSETRGGCSRRVRSVLHDIEEFLVWLSRNRAYPVPLRRKASELLDKLLEAKKELSRDED